VVMLLAGSFHASRRSSSPLGLHASRSLANVASSSGAGAVPPTQAFGRVPSRPPDLDLAERAVLSGTHLQVRLLWVG
jgi:hypothetical protein